MAQAAVKPIQLGSKVEVSLEELENGNLAHKKKPSATLVLFLLHDIYLSQHMSKIGHYRALSW